MPKAMAEPFGRVLESIQRNGKWSASDVVLAAKPKSSEIHSLFEWDDSVAGRLHRETQARQFVRALDVEVIGPKGPVTMPVAVSFGSGDDYTRTETALGTAETRELLVAQALAFFKQAKQRYAYLSELADIFTAIDKAAEKVQRQAAHV